MRWTTYRRILSVQPHALKRLDTFAKVMACDRGQEIPKYPGPAGHYSVMNGAVWRCDVRSDGRRQIVDLIRPRDFVVSDSQNETTIEAIAGETVLASYPGQERDAGFAPELWDVAFQSFPAHHFCSSPVISLKCGLVDPLTGTQTRTQRP